MATSPPPKPCSAPSGVATGGFGAGLSPLWDVLPHAFAQLLTAGVSRGTPAPHRLASIGRRGSARWGESGWVGDAPGRASCTKAPSFLHGGACPLNTSPAPSRLDLPGSPWAANRQAPRRQAPRRHAPLGRLQAPSRPDCEELQHQQRPRLISETSETQSGSGSALPDFGFCPTETRGRQTPKFSPNEPILNQMQINQLVHENAFRSSDRQLGWVSDPSTGLHSHHHLDFPDFFFRFLFIKALKKAAGNTGHSRCGAVGLAAGIPASTRR